MQFLPSALLVTITTPLLKTTHITFHHIPQNKCKTSRPCAALACCFGSSFLYFVCVGAGRVKLGLEFGRIAFSSHIPSCHSPVSSIPQLPQLVRRGKLLHSGRDFSHGFVEQLKLTPFYFCINGPLAIAQFRLFCSSLDSCPGRRAQAGPRQGLFLSIQRATPAPSEQSGWNTNSPT